jgi:outer membrane protein assembly factor BamB
MAARGLSRSRPLLIVAAWVAVVAGLLAPVPDATAAGSGSLTAAPGQGVAGEPLVLKGSTGTKVARAVQLQRKQGGGWSTVAKGKTSAKGKFSFATTFPSASSSYRVKAPRVKVKRTTYAVVTTPVRVVAPQPQGATLTLPPTGQLDDVVEADGAFTPARPGRVVRLEHQSGSAWQLVDQDAEGPTGDVSFDLDLDGVGTQTYRVVAAAAGGASAVASAARSILVQAGSSDTTPPGPVTGLAVTVTTSSTVTLSWTNPGDADLAGVVVRRAAGATPPASPSAGTLVADVDEPGTEITDSGLAAGTQYSYAVFAHDDVPNYSTSRTVTTSTSTDQDTTPPDPVTELSVTDTTSSSVSLSWTNPGDADLTGAMVRRAAGPVAPASPSAGTLVADVTEPGTTVTDSGLAASTQYSYAVFAHDGVPNYASGATVTTSTAAPPDTTPPGPVTGLSVTGTTSSTVTLSWTDPGDADLAGVMVRRAAGATPPASPSAGTLVSDVAKPGTGVTDSGLAAGTQYSYAVFAHDGVPNYSTSKTVTTTTTASSTGDWSQSRHDPEHRGWAPTESVITPGNAASVQEEWSTTGGVPAIVGTTLYDVTSDPLNGHGLLQAHDLTTGAPLWSVGTDGCTSGPVSVTATAVVLGCSQPRAYARTGTHALLWDTADSDPGQFFSNDLVLGDRLVAWSSNAVASYQLSDGQRAWQQLLPAGANSILDVAASGNTVVVAYDDRLRGLNATTGGQLWSTAGIVSSQLVIAGGFVYTNDDGGVSRYSLATGAADGWTVPDGSNVYQIEAADADTVYVWEAVFDFGPPSPSVLHALRASDGTQRWQYDVPSRVASVAIAGDVVWLTSTDIFSQGRNADLIALNRVTGDELRHVNWADNFYGWTSVAFADGKVVVNQGGSAGMSPSRLRVLGLAGPRPTVTTPVLPLGRTGQAYSATIEATGAGPMTWTIDSGSLPAGLNLSPAGVVSGTPTTPGTARVVVRATGTNGRTDTRSLPLQVVTSGTPSWTTTARDATRNAFEPGMGELDLPNAPSIAFRWKTTPPGPTQFGYDQDVALSGTTLYTVGWDGALKAFDTTGSQANRAPVWSALPSAGNGQGYVGPVSISGTRILVADNDGRVHGVSTVTGADLWHTDTAVAWNGTAPLVVGTGVFVRDGSYAIRGFSVADGTPLWNGSASPATDVWSSLSSDGTRIYGMSKCDVVAVNAATGGIAWQVPVRIAPADQCAAAFNTPPTPVVAGGRVYAGEPAARVVLDAATGAVDLRFAISGFGNSSGVVVGGLWCFESDSHVVAVDTATGLLAWRSADTVGDGAELSSTGDLLLVSTQSQVVGISRLDGETVVDAGTLLGVGGVPAIGTNRFFLTAQDGTRAYGPIS